MGPLTDVEWPDDMGLGVLQPEDLTDAPVDHILEALAFKPHGYPDVPTELWHKIRARPDVTYSGLQRALARHIVRHNVPFPLSPPTEAEAKADFLNLLSRSPVEFLGPYIEGHADYAAKYEYKHWPLDQTIAHLIRRNVGGKASNHFQQDNRFSTGGWKDAGAMIAWRDEDLLAKVRWPSWVMRDGPLGNKWSSIVRLANGLYVPSPFRPSAAKAMYGWLGGAGGRILDPSCGWGDRLAAFYATPTAKLYVGCDPNGVVWRTYQDQCRTYERWLGTADPHFQVGKISGYSAFLCRGTKDVLIVNGPFEDIDWARVRDRVAPGGFDLAFTSPPYFGVERYGEGSPSEGNQSWSRYVTPDAWFEGFLLPVWETASGLIADTGFLAINIADPGVDNVRHEVCDPMVEELVGLGMSYEGVVALALTKRPSSGEILGAMQADRFAEPIWMFGKGANLPPVRVEDREHVAEGEVDWASLWTDERR